MKCSICYEPIKPNILDTYRSEEDRIICSNCLNKIAQKKPINYPNIHDILEEIKKSNNLYTIDGLIYNLFEKIDPNNTWLWRGLCLKHGQCYAFSHYLKYPKQIPSGSRLQFTKFGNFLINKSNELEKKMSKLNIRIEDTAEHVHNPWKNLAFRATLYIEHTTKNKEDFDVLADNEGTPTNIGTIFGDDLVIFRDNRLTQDITSLIKDYQMMLQWINDQKPKKIKGKPVSEETSEKEEMEWALQRENIEWVIRDKIRNNYEVQQNLFDYEPTEETQKKIISRLRGWYKEEVELVKNHIHHISVWLNEYTAQESKKELIKQCTQCKPINRNNTA